MKPLRLLFLLSVASVSAGATEESLKFPRIADWRDMQQSLDELTR